MREQHRSDGGVVAQHVALGERDGRIEHLVEVRQGEALPSTSTGVLVALIVGVSH